MLTPAFRPAQPLAFTHSVRPVPIIVILEYYSGLGTLPKHPAATYPLDPHPAQDLGPHLRYVHRANERHILGG